MSSEPVEQYMKSILRTLFCNSIIERRSSTESLAEQLVVSSTYIDEVCEYLFELGLISMNGDEWSLTDIGRKNIVVVMAGGVFDIIHPGHIFTLSSAKRLGDILIVSIARDSTVKKMKDHLPINTEEKRVTLVEALKCVDIAILGSETNMFQMVEKVKPNIIALGYDQKHDTEKLKKDAEDKGIEIEVTRFDTPLPNLKSSNILKNSKDVDEF